MAMACSSTNHYESRQLKQPAPEHIHHGVNQVLNRFDYRSEEVRTALNFFKDPEDGSVPYLWVPGDAPYSKNFGDEQISLTIADARDLESMFSLDRDGFELISNVPSALQDFNDDKSIRTVYFEEMERLLLNQIEGAKKVTLFDYTVRRSNPGSTSAPALRVHIDQTARSAESRVKLHDSQNAEELLKGRYRIINVWRPINGVVESYPLAFASAKSVRLNDLVTVEHRSPKRTGETAGVRWHERQRWYYWNRMDSNEVVLLKCFDSSDGAGVAKRVAHSAFEHPNSGTTAKERQSIEVRALVYG